MAHVLLQGHTDELWGLCTHPFLNRFLTCGHDRQLCLWDGEGHALAWSIDLKVEPRSRGPQCHPYRDSCGPHAFLSIPFPSAPRRQLVCAGMATKCSFFCGDASSTRSTTTTTPPPATDGYSPTQLSVLVVQYFECHLV